MPVQCERLLASVRLSNILRRSLVDVMSYGTKWSGGNYEEYSEDDPEEVVEIRTMDTKGEMIKIRAEKKQVQARVRALLHR